MNIKSITTLGLVAVALAVTSLAPAEAKNNNKALNDLAMQMYMQNQAAAGATNIYNPALVGNASIYNNPAFASTYGVNAYNGQTPWSAGAMGNAIPGVVNASYGATPWSAGALPYGSNYGNNYGGRCGNNSYNSAYGNIVSPQYNRLAQEIARLRAKLANPNISWNDRNRINSKLNQLSIQQTNLASVGYGSPYNNGGLLNNVRGYLGF